MTFLNNGLGILGGSFDPIHLGHTKSAQAVADELGLTKVLLIPAYISPLKVTTDLRPQATAEQRGAMVEIICQQNPLFSCDTRELQRAGHSYTVDTLKALKRQNPNRPLLFIIGMDSLNTFTQWHQYQAILSLCHLVVNTRPNHPIEQTNSETNALLAKHRTTDRTQLLTLAAGKIFFSKPIFYDISSTQIRQHIAQHKSCPQQLDIKISDYIDKNKLYR
ncbi:MAG: nicotinate-nucleotide adenylyltransferase [Colwellia sp.]